MTVKACPNCKEAQYEAQDQTINIKNVLDRWEQETPTRFQDQTWTDYDGVTESTFHKCTSCGYGAFVPPISGTSNFYNDITDESDYYIADKWEFQQAIALIKKHNVRSLLDYGSGGGAFLKEVRKRFPDIELTAHDENPQSKKALKGTDIQFLQNLDDADDKKYDMVTTFQVVEHLEDPFTVLNKLKSLLNPEGVLILTVPNADGPIRHFPNALTEMPPHHVSRFNKSSLLKALGNAGYNVDFVGFEPLPKILWEGYLPVMARESLSGTTRDMFVKCKGQGAVRTIAKVLSKTPLKSLPLVGHTILVTSKPCAA
jgi:SAM-dependent methyltransferase